MFRICSIALTALAILCITPDSLQAGSGTPAITTAR